VRGRKTPLMDIPWSALGLGQFVAIAGDGSAFFREGAHVRKAALPNDPTVLRVTYGEAVEHGIPNLDLSLLYRGLFPCEPDHGLASACAARGIAHRSKAAAVSVGKLLLCVVTEAATLDRGMLQLLGYLCGGAVQDLLLGLATLPIPAEPEEEGISRSAAAPKKERGWAAEDDVLGPNGLIARQLPPHEVRRGQLDMAGAVAETLRLGGALCVEAGPGTGKTFAYLVPALVHLEAERASRVVVCTRTKQLQEQVFRKDLPFLASLMSSEVATAILKGRENYLCLRRWEILVREMSDGLERERLTSLASLGRWVFDTETGDIEENSAFLAQDDARELWSRLGDSPTSCAGSFCPHVDECFSIRARRLARKADLVVVNHSLLLSDAAAGGVVLGKYTRLIVDEAHAFEATARLAFTATLSEARVERVADELGPGRSGRRHGWFDRLSLPPEQSHAAAAGEATALVRSLAVRVVQAVATRIVDDRRGSLPELSAVAEELAALRSALRRWEILVEETIERVRGEPELAREGEGGLAAIGELVHVCDVLAAPAVDNTVHWYEWEFGRLALHVTPLDVAPILEVRVYQGIESMILTSATLSLGGDFTYLKESLGLPHAFDPVRTAVVESPFQYENLMRILLPSGLPSVLADPGAYADALASLLVELHRALGRNGLVLFTSYDLLFEVRKRIHERVPTLAQGVDGSRTALLERFRREPQGMILLGTDSFWEGIDLPGEELEYVVVTRLPFAVPTDPVFAALSLELSRRGKDAFLDLALPQAVLRLRQGVGRLIRTRTDRGVVILTDERIRTKLYGRRFAEALPVPVESVASARDAAREAARWFDGRGPELT
jgi:Rad3-related DNA helicase